MKKVIAYCPFTGGLIALGIGVAYCARNKSGHSGVDPVAASPLFLPILGVGCLLFLFQGYRRVAALTTVVGLAGVLFGYYVVHFKVMQSHGTWLKNGQIMSQHSDIHLTAFVIIILLGLGVGLWCTRTRETNDEG